MADYDVPAMDHPIFREANAYAWGRQDSGDEEHDTEHARQFALAYLERWNAFGVSEGTRPNLCAAYEEWRHCGVITHGHHAPTRRRLPALTDQQAVAPAMVVRTILEQQAAPADRQGQLERWEALPAEARTRLVGLVRAVIYSYASVIDAELVSDESGGE
ncbi:MAG TPA: hypothetical protein VFW65_32025 [Pseudonocardiaceae bacterium]|nr:hypothetical protein [Pseudonocardiaceae bacterium]